MHFKRRARITMASTASRFTRLMQSETGPKTVHFWAPVMKWGLVVAGFSDLQRPVEKLSGTQSLALFATGVIWTRWAGFVIRPRNILLASVNLFLGGVAGVQIYRIVNYRKQQGDSPKQIWDYMINGENANTMQKVQ